MLSTIKKMLIFLIVLTILIFGGLFLYNLNRTYFNDDSEVGNTPGNIYNGGLFSEQDGKIYFSNPKDNESLYVMSSDCKNVEPIHTDKAVYINVDENYIYYVRANYTRQDNPGGLFVFNNTGIYRIDRKGTNLKSVSDNPGAYLTLRGNYLYYQNYDVNNGLFLYRNKIDISDERLLLREAVIPTAVIDNRLYYAGYEKDHNLNSVDLSSYTTTTNIKGSFLYPIIFGDYIYYMNIEDNYKLYRMNKDGSEPTKLVNERCSTYNITNSGRYLYYQIDSGKKSRICRLDLTTNKAQTLLKGNYKQINVTEKYVFFKDFDDTNTYVVSAEGSSKIGKFNPPDKTK